MSDVSLDVQEQIARIRRTQVEIDNYAEETRKFVAEQHKLMAEGDKYRSERWLPYTVAGAAIVGGLATVGVSIGRALGLVP